MIAQTRQTDLPANMTACTLSSKYRIVDCSRTNHINIQCTNDLKIYATSQQSCELLPVRTIPKNRRCHHVALRFPGGGGAGDGRAIDVTKSPGYFLLRRLYLPHWHVWVVLKPRADPYIPHHYKLSLLHSAQLE